MEKALFLDRDGILNVDKGYVYKWEDIVWFDEIYEIIEHALKKNYLVIVLTNQSGIYYNKYTKEDVERLHKQMSEHLAQKNLKITDWIYCADVNSESRKPRPGMLLEAQKKFKIDLANSFMVGDKVTDVFETDGAFIRPKTFLLRGQYDLSKAEQDSEIKIFGNHKDILEELKRVL